MARSGLSVNLLALPWEGLPRKQSWALHGLFSVLTRAIRSSSALNPYACTVRNMSRIALRPTRLPPWSTSYSYSLAVSLRVAPLIFTMCGSWCNLTYGGRRTHEHCDRCAGWQGTCVLLGYYIASIPFLPPKCDFFFHAPSFFRSVKPRAQDTWRIFDFWSFTVKSVKCGLKSTDVLVPASVRK